MSMSDLRIVIEGGRLDVETRDGRFVSVREILAALEVAENAVLDGVGLQSRPRPGPGLGREKSDAGGVAVEKTKKISGE